MHLNRHSGCSRSRPNGCSTSSEACPAALSLSPLLAADCGSREADVSGPVFFRQDRIGAFGKPVHDAEVPDDARRCRSRTASPVRHRIHQRWRARQPVGRQWSVQDRQRSAGDLHGPHVRKTSLDELPQFWNVLRGDMSLVGPRPPLSYEVEQYKRWHYRRVLEAKPGITGLWQVTGRSRTNFDDMVRLDLAVRAESVGVDRYQDSSRDASCRHLRQGRLLSAYCVRSPLRLPSLSTGQANEHYECSRS